MSGMRRDAMFDVVTADQLIKIIGHDIWTSEKVNKERKAKHKSRRAMRSVARLKIAVGVLSVRELFIVGNIKKLESSMQQLCVEEGKWKQPLGYFMTSGPM